VLFLYTIKKLPSQPASFYKPLETVTMTVTPHCTQKKTQKSLFFVRLLGVENSVVCVAAGPCHCSLRRCVLARTGRRLAVRTGKRNYVGGGGGMCGSAARVGAGGVVISGLSKACLRARAWCDVAPANAVCCLASQGFSCAKQQVVDSWQQEEENYSTLSCGA